MGKRSHCLDMVKMQNKFALNISIFIQIRKMYIDENLHDECFIFIANMLLRIKQ
jgi:hypothetical protein